jgi:iron complex transport system ATP-binding protein
MLAVENITFAYGARHIFDGLSLGFEPGCFHGIIGPNGSGKSTLVDLLCGHARPARGTVRLDGRPLAAYSRKSLARRIALVPQAMRLDFPYTCAEVVMMGRYPHIPRFTSPGETDRRVVAAVLAETALIELADCRVSRLSGGERQRVVFARALAQETDVLLLDEATAHLDMHHAIGLLNLATRRVARGGLVVAVFQDVNLAAMYCDRLVCLHAGRVFAQGSTAAVLTSEMLGAVFRVRARVDRIPGQSARRVVLTKETVA